MKNKIIYTLFVLCLVKIYYIADKNLKFSPDLLKNTFKENAGEIISLNNAAQDVISTKKFFLEKNIYEFQLSDSIIEKNQLIYQRMVEFIYPIKVKKKSSIFISHNTENIRSNCKIIHNTKNLNIYDCK